MDAFYRSGNLFARSLRRIRFTRRSSRTNDDDLSNQQSQ
jgi:hypothetical protein